MWPSDLSSFFYGWGLYTGLHPIPGRSVNLHPVQEGKITFDLLCTKHDISPREKDIMREICNGLSNQQIADKLFISLQTVKDHTSRIYYKTNCTGRAQLITMVYGGVT